MYDKNDKYLANLKIQYIGQQERTRDKFSLDMFTDLVTGSSFLRLPLEGLEQAVERVRRRFRQATTREIKEVVQ